MQAVAIEQARNLGLDVSRDPTDQEKKPESLTRVMAWVKERIPGKVRARRGFGPAEEEQTVVSGWRILISVDKHNQAAVMLFCTMYPEMAERYFFFEEHTGQIQVRRDGKLIDQID